MFQIAAISEQASESSKEDSYSEENFKSRLAWKSFDMRAVVAATEDLLLFILSDQGQMVRVFLLRDILAVTDSFLQDEVLGCGLNGKRERQHTTNSEVCLICSLLPSKLFYD